MTIAPIIEMYKMTPDSKNRKGWKSNKYQPITSKLVLVLTNWKKFNKYKEGDQYKEVLEKFCHRVDKTKESLNNHQINIGKKNQIPIPLNTKLFKSSFCTDEVFMSNIITTNKNKTKIAPKYIIKKIRPKNSTLKKNSKKAPKIKISINNNKECIVFNIKTNKLKEPNIKLAIPILKNNFNM